MKHIQILIVDRVDLSSEAKKKIILDVFARAINKGRLAEVCESFLESDASNDVEAAINAAREWNI